MALQSAWLLSACLTTAGKNQGVSPAVWQSRIARQYDTEWRRLFRPRFLVASVFAHVAMRPTAARGLMAIAQVWPGLLSLGARWAEKAGPCVIPQSVSALAPLEPTGATP